MNLANRLTILRLLLIPVFMLFILSGDFYMPIAALAVFIIAALTDLYDGIVARRTNTVTTLGIFLDPLADKLLISASLIAFVELDEIFVPAWMVVMIISREFIITGLRVVAASKGRILPATKAGKFKTTSQVTAIITILVVLSVNWVLYKYLNIDPQSYEMTTGSMKALTMVLRDLPYWMMLVTTVLTVVSGISYIKNNLDIIKE